MKKFKARFCACGDQQLEGIDFFETNDPVVQWTNVCLMLTLENLLCLKSKQAAVTATFLHIMMHYIIIFFSFIFKFLDHRFFVQNFYFHHLFLLMLPVQNITDSVSIMFIALFFWFLWTGYILQFCCSMLPVISKQHKSIPGIQTRWFQHFHFFTFCLSDLILPVV